MYSRLIENIDLADESSWNGDQVFITLDIDWCPDFILNEVIAYIEKLEVKVTWFTTHKTIVLDNLFQNSNFELAAHPNFNPILFDASVEKGKGAKEIIEQIKIFTPNAKSIRSHSLTQSSPLSKAFVDLGFKYECNLLLPQKFFPSLRPWRDFSGIIKVPHFWEDDVDILFNDNPISIKKISKSAGLKVFLFHPIHIFLNTFSNSHYLEYKKLLQNQDAVMDLINVKNKGIGDVFKELIENVH